MAGGGLSGVVNQAAAQGGNDSARPSAPLPTPGGGPVADTLSSFKQQLGYPQGYQEPQRMYQAQPYRPAGPEVAEEAPQGMFAPSNRGFNPFMAQQPQRQPSWQQSDEWKGYQTQMSDLQNQLNQSPIMQQLQQLQAKMQGYQQQYAQPQQQMYQQPRYGQRYGLQSLFNNIQYQKGGRV